MRYFSIFMMAVIVGLGFVVLNADQASAQDDCEITIVKSANPAIDTGFDFLVTGGPLSFVLRDPSDDIHVINILHKMTGIQRL